MNTPHCCQTATQGRYNARRPASWWLRGRKIAGWILPSAALALLPKCPACLVAYVALATGFGISLSAAAHLRTLLLLSCTVSLGFVATRRLRRFLAHGADIPLEKEEAR